MTLSDTWRWSGTAWTRLAPGSPTPPARTGAALTWDPAIGSTVLFGGSSSPLGSGPPKLLADTWTWDGSAWANVASPTSPPGRVAAVSASAGDLGGDLVFSGDTATGPEAGTWAFDGTTWSRISTAGNPPPRSGAAGAWDSATGDLVAFGGSGTSGTLGDTILLANSAPVVATPSTSSSTTAAAPSGGTTTSAPPARGSGPSSPTSGPPTSLTHNHGSAASGPATVPTLGVVPSGNATPGGAAAPTTQTVHAGSLVTLLGSGFKPGAVITITFHSTPFTIGRAVANARGSFSATVAVPAEASVGMHHLVAAGVGRHGGTTTLVTPVQVVPFVAATDPGTSAATTATMVGLAVAIPLVTWLLLGLRSRRRRPAVRGT